MGSTTKLGGRVSEFYLKYGTIVTSLGVGNQEHMEALVANKSGVKKVDNSGFNKENWFLGKIKSLKGNRYNSLLTLACEDLKKKVSSDILISPKTLVIVSSTKANIEVLPLDTFQSTCDIINTVLGVVNQPIIISNACISGVLAINTAADYLKIGRYDDVIIIGIDSLSDFVVFGFQSLFAMSEERCNPFDINRQGVSLGEACGILILSTKKDDSFSVEFLGGASSNDANHISGPSRTGEGLLRAVSKTLQRAGIEKEQIDFISAHGTGTVYNDEMESIAFNRLGLQSVPMNSLKAYFGHTLGAAGIIEVIVCMISMEHNMLFQSLGFSTQGTTEKLNVISENQKAAVNIVLKTASGFGGGNAALILKKAE